ncbi:glycosyltransferase family 4 protein [Isoptericola sp. NPDC019482]|uniref:glycosyltransferase family 4 protein n=1 Tax=Isoptericola sp. NPDC019482 TaxID=3154688 RepID=UPI003492C727
MKVVHAIRSDGFAGVERHVARLARTQEASGHTVHVIGGAVGPMAGELAGSGVSVEPAATTVDVVRALRAQPQHDVLHVHMTAAEVAATLAGVAAWRHRAPVVTTRHFARPRGTGPAGGAVAAVARARVRAQMSISAFVADSVDGSSTVIHPGVDSQPDAAPARGREKVVLMAQRLAPEKAAEVGVRAFAASGLRDDGWTLRVAGDGPLRSHLQQVAEEIGVADKVEWLGFRGDVPDLLRTSALLLAPCPVEGLGLSVLEAMAHGLPVVAAAAGGHVELLTGLCSPALTSDVLFPAGSAARAGAALAALAAAPEARDAYGAAAQARQRKGFTLEAQVAATDAVYRSVR